MGSYYKVSLVKHTILKTKAQMNCINDKKVFFVMFGEWRERSAKLLILCCTEERKSSGLNAVRGSK